MTCYSIDGLVPVIDPSAFVHPSASLIGDVVIEAGVYVGPGASLRGDWGRIILRAGSNLQDNCIMHSFPGNDAVVERNGHIGHGAVLHGCVVGENALIGMNSVIMDGVMVGEESIVGAASFVKAGMIIPRRSLIAGVPAKILREVSEEEVAWKSKGTAAYQDLVARCHNSFRQCDPLPAMEPNRPRIQADLQPLHELREKGRERS